jgi:hypothetical protein
MIKLIKKGDIMNKKIIIGLAFVLLSLNSFATDAKKMPHELSKRPRAPLMHEKMKEAFEVCSKEAGIAPPQAQAKKRAVPTKEQRLQVNKCMQEKVKALRSQQTKK